MMSMILLLGGTSDAQPIALRLAEAGYRVLVSQATDVPLETASARATSRARCGPLDERGLAELVDRRGIRAIVDATHPYAVAVHAAAGRVADEKGIPCLCFLRPAAVDGDRSRRGVCGGPRGCRRGRVSPRPARLAHHGNEESRALTSSRRAAPACRLTVRVLDHPESLDACRRAGIRPEQVIAGRGPFSVEDNRRHIRACGAGVLVTKDSGTAGGTAEKLQAARAEGCEVIVIARPALGSRPGFMEVEALLTALAHALGGSG